MPYKQDDDFDSFGGYDTNNGFSQDQFGFDPYLGGDFGSLGSYFPESIGNDNIADGYSDNNDSAPVENGLTYNRVVKDSVSEMPPENNTFGKVDTVKYKVTEDDVRFQKKNKLKLVIILAVFMLIADVMLIFGSNINKERNRTNQEYLDNGTAVNGRIVKVDYETTSKSFYLVATIEYKYNNVDYKTVKKYKDNTSKKVGDTVSLVVLPNNPSNPQLKSALVVDDEKSSLIIFILIGAFFSAPFFVAVIHYIRFRKNPYALKYYKNEEAKFYREQRRRMARLNSDEEPGSIWKTEFGSKSSGNSSASGKVKIKKDPLGALKLARTMLILGITWMMIFAVPATIIGVLQKQDEDFFDKADKISAKITHVTAVKRSSTSRNKHSRSSSTYYDYYATVEYQVGDTLYRRGEFMISAGDNTTKRTIVYIDPDNPGDCRVKDIKNSRTWYIFALCSIACIGLITALISLCVYVSERKKLKF